MIGWRMAASAILALSLAASCGTDGDEAGTAQDSATETSAVEAGTVVAGDGEAGAEEEAIEDGDPNDPAAADRSPLESMLAIIPDTEENRGYVELNNYLPAIEAYGVEPPRGVDADDQEVGDYLLALRLGTEPPLSLFPFGFEQTAVRVAEWGAEFGFSVLDVQQVAVAGQPPTETFAAHGDGLTAEAVDAAVRNDPQWSTELIENSHAGIAYYTWGDDPMAIGGTPTATRPLGRGGALAVLEGGTVIRSIDPATTVAAVDAANGTVGSLADNPSFAGIARALDANAVHTAVLSNRPILIDPLYVVGGLSTDLPSAEEMEERLDSIPTVPPYLALGVGHAVDGNQALLVVSFAMLDSGAADAMVEAYPTVVDQGISFVTEEPWSSILSIREGGTDGNIATIVLETEQPALGLSAFSASDSLFVVG